MKVLHSFSVALTDPAPPSVNRLYTNGYRGRKMLSKEGVAFKAALVRAVAAEIGIMQWPKAIDAVYIGHAWIRLTIVIRGNYLNKSWKPGKLTPKSGPSSPYQKVDASNYVKIIEDAVAEATGIDDSAHFDVPVSKREGPPGVELAYEVLEWPPS